jgi:hypothetical protein
MYGVPVQHLRPVQHLGYYKSISASRAVQRRRFSHQRRIFGVLADVIDAAMQTGFVFDSAKIVNAMIEKIPGHH